MNLPDPMAEILASFFVECEDLLEALQDGLTAMDSGDTDPEVINVCFRAVHSIKGGAGAFGLDDLVRFAHRFETVMDEIRSGNLEVDRESTALFFRAADVLSDIVRASRDETPIDEQLVESALKDLEALTIGLDGADEGKAEEEPVDFQPMTLSFDLDGEDDQPDGGGFKIYFRPQPELYASGNEPLHIIRGLGQIGKLQVTLDHADVPILSDLVPENAHIGFTFDLETTKSRSEVEEVFEFVDDLCVLQIEGMTSNLTPGTPEPDAPEEVLNAAATSHDHVTTAEKSTEPQASAPAPKPTSQNQKTASPKPDTPTQANATVRVDLDRIERLVNLVGELVINQAMLSQSVAEAGLTADIAVSTGLEEFMQLTRNIQESVMMIRAQPVKSLFQRMSRIVREASSAIGKSVRLVAVGEATEVDKTVIERLADPLTHMIRNAVDHGLESTADRIAAGKPADGTVTLTAAHRSGRVVIEISDDGGGINRPKVREIAESKGLIPEGLQLSDSEIDALLFLPGFSTASEVSALSGRGVGMDVVRSAITALGGRITITSEKGIGTTFSISLPLTLAVLDGMVVEAAGETLVVPLGSIVETLSLTSDMIERVGSGSVLAKIRDDFVSLVDLGHALGFREPASELNGCVVLLISKEDGKRAALIVDQIVEQRQVVIKGLQESYGHVAGIAAATILGNGRIALILDPIDLIASANDTNKPTRETLDLAG